jgi:hypothetical protein
MKWNEMKWNEMICLKNDKLSLQIIRKQNVILTKYAVQFGINVVNEL